MSVYYNPEKFGLSVIGEMEFSTGSYEFDTTVVWKSNETGALYYAEDSGCSCPIPFDSIGWGELTRIDDASTFLRHLEKRVDDTTYGWVPDGERDFEKDEKRVRCGELYLKVKAAMKP